MTASGLPECLTVCLTAVSVGMLHTLLGPDHYLPFVAMSRAGDWPIRKTLRVTAACGLAHVMGSVVIGLVGLALGLAAMRLATLEALRGDVAAWLMIGFGVAYLTWGLVRIGRSHGFHEHVHARGRAGPAWSPWLLFLVFAFGPCEPLIPLLMYPAVQSSWSVVAAAVVSFTAGTLVTMCAAVVALGRGASLLPMQAMHHYGHALAGGAILACGVSLILGL